MHKITHGIRLQTLKGKGGDDIESTDNVRVQL
jgi:hypothetical protein